MDLDDLRNRSDLLSNSKTKKVCRAILKEKVKARAEQHTKDVLASRLRKKEQLDKRNKNFIVSEASPSGTVKTNDKVTFYGNSTLDLPNTSDDVIGTTLREFFMRPVLIDDFTIALNTDVVRSIYPWDLWSKNPTVRAKLRTYAYFSGTLCLRFTLSSSKYHFGSIMLSNQPYSDLNAVLIALEESFTIEGTSRPLNNYLSQSPERINIKIGTDNTMEMRLPMLVPKEKVRLFNQDGLVIDNSVSFEEFLPLGELFMTTVNRVLSASADIASSVKIQTYAWVEDLNLSGATSTEIDITSEAAPVDKMIEKGKDIRSMITSHPVVKAVSESAAQYADDEYSPANGGSLSTVFSAVSNIAENFKDIPMLGAAARATAMVSGYGAQALKYFGFSKPPQINDPEFTKNIASDNFSNVAGLSTSHKLTLFPKQELSVHSIGGDTDMDPMALKFITARETYLHTFVWSPTDTPRSSTLFMSAVCPNLNTGITNTLLQPSALSWAAHYFYHWRGTISFRFEVIASSFHRGKLMFIFEPNASNSVLTAADTTNLNQQCIFYLDIEEGRDLTVDCGYLSDRFFSNTRRDTNIGTLGQGYEAPNYGGASPAINAALYNENVSIGNLFVRPFTTLVGPDTAANIEINVYVYSNDMELARPIEMDQPVRVILSEAEPRLDASKGGKQVLDGTLNRTSDTYTLINNTRFDNNDIYQYHFGEKIESFRTLLKRSVLTNLSILNDRSDTNTNIMLELPMYPVPTRANLPGYDAIPNAAALTARDGTHYSLFNELRLSYLFMKGGYRHKVVLSMDPVELKDTTFTAALTTNNLEYKQYEWSRSTVPDVQATPQSTGGMIFDSRINGLVDVEIPYFSTNLFELACKCYKVTTDFSSPLFRYDNPLLNVRMERLDLSTTSANDRYFKDYTSAAEDFCFFRFQGSSFVSIQ